MRTVTAFVKRNIKLFFKDKGMFFVSLITPMILLVLYATFLADVYRDAYVSSVPAGLIPDKVIDGCVAGQLFSSLLAVSCVTVAFCSNGLMVQDKVTGVKNDLLMTPVQESKLALGYYVASVLSTLLICVAATGMCFVYIAIQGWYLSVGDVVLIFVDILLLVLFGTALSSVIHYFLNSQGQISAVGTIVSSGYGFICGAYMPISQFGEGLQAVLSFLPGTYGTALIRNHSLRGVFAEMEALGTPEVLVEELKGVVDCSFEFFGNTVSIGAMYAVVIGWIVLLLGAYILLHTLKLKRK
ncbi:MAG: ABC transporter permease [Clostridia bacterium]|nr:ABC transporter permease [Clostridia bacterium]